MDTLTLHNARIPSVACVDLAHPERPPVHPTPVFVRDSGPAYFPVLCAGETPMLMTAAEIVSLDGKVPHEGDRMIMVDGRKVWIGANCWMIRCDSYDGKPWFTPAPE